MPITKTSLTKSKSDQVTQNNNTEDTSIAATAVDVDGAINISMEMVSEIDAHDTDAQNSTNDHLHAISLDELNESERNLELRGIYEATLDEVKKAPIFTSVKAKQKNGISGDSGLLSVVNPEDNTKCLLIKRELTNKINVSEEVQFGFGENELLIMKPISEDENTFRLRKRGSNFVVYSAELVEEITDYYGLDYSEGRTCRTFGEVRYDYDFNIAYVSIT